MTDTSILNVVGLAKSRHTGPDVADDTAVVTTGSVYEVDASGARVRVDVRGGIVWLPAIADRYSPQSHARVLLDPWTSRPVLVLGTLAPRTPVVLGKVLATPTSNSIDVDVDGTTYSVPALPASYTVGDTAWLHLDEWGTPFLCLGPSSTPPPPTSTPTAPTTPTTAPATATIGPQSSGTYSVNQGRWDTWNAGRYGGASDIYQGNAYGSGPLVGFAGYGDQIVNLGAISIDEITLSARKTGDGNSAVLSVQGSPSGGRPGGGPGGSGDTVSTASIGSAGWGSTAFTGAMRDAFRTGALKGLVAVGGQYGGFGGTATPGSFVLNIRYTRAV